VGGFWLRWAALGVLRLFAAKSLVSCPAVRAICVPLCLNRQRKNRPTGFRKWDIMAHQQPGFFLCTRLNSPLAAPQLSLIHRPKLRLIKVN
jgi:hypothetical protein